MVEAGDDKQLAETIARYGRPDLLCLAEPGVLELGRTGAELLFHVLPGREEKSAVAIASNEALSGWAKMFTDPRLGAAIDERLTFNAGIITGGHRVTRLRVSLSWWDDSGSSLLDTRRAGVTMIESTKRVVQQTGATRVGVGAKRIRAYLGGELVADTTTPWLVWERPYCPTYFFPVGDVRAELVPVDDQMTEGGAQVCDVRTLHASAPAAARCFPDTGSGVIGGLVRLDWDAMDAWFEEDEPVYTHPRNPYTRIDILASSRSVRVEIAGVRVAESRQPRILFETGLRPRYYLPYGDVRTDVLRPSATVTHCPYKGAASYWSAELAGVVHQDVAWMYRAPLLESVKIAGLLCFYDERVDLYVDGAPQRAAQPHPDQVS